MTTRLPNYAAGQEPHAFYARMIDSRQEAAETGPMRQAGASEQGPKRAPKGRDPLKKVGQGSLSADRVAE